MYASLRTIVVCLVALAGRTQELRPEFESAEVRAGEPSTATPGSITPHSGFLRGGRYEFDNVTLVDLISTAWNVDRDRVFGGPAWIDRVRFGIVARIPPNQSLQSVHFMLQSLLVDRFHLAVHQGTRPFAQYVLTTGRRLHLKRRPAPAKPDAFLSAAQPPTGQSRAAT